MADIAYVIAGQNLAKAAGISTTSVTYRQARRRLKNAYAQAEKEARAAEAVGKVTSNVAGAVGTVGAVAGGVAALGAGTGGAGFATAAAVSAAAGPIGLIASVALLGTAATLSIVGAARKGRANAIAASDLHGAESRKWGRAYLHYWNVFNRGGKKAINLIDKGDKLVERINKLKKKRQTKKRRKKIKALQLRASALSTVFLEIGLDAPYPAQSVVDTPDSEQDTLDSDDSDDADEAEKPSLLPKALIVLSVLRLLL